MSPIARKRAIGQAGDPTDKDHLRREASDVDFLRRGRRIGLGRCGESETFHVQPISIPRQTNIADKA